MNERRSRLGWHLPAGVVLLLAAFVCAVNDVPLAASAVIGLVGIACVSWGLVDSDG